MSYNTAMVDASQCSARDLMMYLSRVGAAEQPLTVVRVLAYDNIGCSNVPAFGSSRIILQVSISTTAGTQARAAVVERYLAVLNVSHILLLLQAHLNEMSGDHRAALIMKVCTH